MTQIERIDAEKQKINIRENPRNPCSKAFCSIHLFIGSETSLDDHIFLEIRCAQLGVYLRLNDVPVPGMYGPTADEV